MKKINRKDLLKIIDSDKTELNYKEELDLDKISELKLGKNFIYMIKSYPELEKVQKRLVRFFLKKIEINNSAVAYRNNYSYFNLLEPHRNNYNFLRLDIKSFFYSININDIIDTFKEYFEKDTFADNPFDEEKLSLLNTFIKLVTIELPVDSENKKYINKRVLPIGFITSPIISNIIFRKLDIQIQKFCEEKEITYTRYADDMIFSSQKGSSFIHSKTFMKELKIILFQMKFKLNKDKIMKRKHTLSLNGYTIQYSRYTKFSEVIVEEKINELRLSNKKLYIIHKFITMIKKQKLSEGVVLNKLFKINCFSKKHELDQLLNKATGYRSYLLSIIIFNKKYKTTKKETILKYSEIINDLEKLINIFTDKLKKYENT